jgi:hypothetical protein
MPRVGFDPTIQAMERAKTVHALDRVVTVFCILDIFKWFNKEQQKDGMTSYS